MYSHDESAEKSESMHRSKITVFHHPREEKYIFTVLIKDRKDLCAEKQVKIEKWLEWCCQIENSDSILQWLIFSCILATNKE